SQPGRSFLTWVFILVTAILFCSAITAVWLRQTLFDTNTWVKATSTIMKNSSVQHDIAEKTVQTIFTSVNVNQYVTELLPDKAKPLAGTITGSLQTFSTDQVQKLLASSQFDQFWQNANRQAHVALLKTIQTANDKSQPSAKDEVVFIQKDQIILNVAPVLQNLKGALVSAGLGFVNNLNVSGLNLTIPLATVQNLPAILLAVNTINNLAFWLPIVVLIFAALTLWVSRNKRKTIMHIAIVTAVLLISSIVSINVGGYLFVTNLTAQVSAISSGSAQVVYSTLTADLLSYEKVALALMLLIVLFTYLTGTSQPALWVRDEISGLLKGEAKTPALQWLGTYSTLIIGILIAATALLIVFAPFRSAPLTLISASVAGLISIFLLAVRKATTKNSTKK
ncbi:hypothetical protein H0W80_03830, partial [Candidatus Saccharibacteria bacterium]|nr:hypothetical protein [Candidatus Saccharibacteria bacterium]